MILKKPTLPLRVKQAKPILYNGKIMSAIVKLSEQIVSDHSILSSAFCASVLSFEDAAKKLKNAAPGTYLTFYIHTQNYCAAVGKNGNVVFNPFTWLASGEFFNGCGPRYPTPEALLDHLVDGQRPIPYSGK